MDTVNLITSLVSSVGFPVVVAGYLLIIQKKTVDENTKVLSKLCGLMDKLMDKLDVKADDVDE